ncbi:MAG: hypothetical protein RM022_021540 [Nostoc sp. EfeVER01]|uniref:hypothetical protein n=1 Tax=unclassified Nostoc TaxID=2593658 RepID=UPI002AD41540|nr:MULTISPECIES: hypothetical protein [unclassified Nostoc]MDZ7949405.1 hypothetical protein [Nostoc sp. EfeVER01]MDZ7993804.1 hypothetical protein [Nostoc sp. EspVER01]
MFKGLFKRTTGTLLFIGVSILIFVGGYYIGRLPDDPGKNNKVSEKQKILLPILIGYIPIGVTALEFFINSRVDEESKNKIESNKKECESKIKSYAISYLQTIDTAETKLAGRDDDVSLQIIGEFRKIRQVFEEYIENYDAAQEIIKWLDDDKMRHDLIVEIVVVIAENKYNLTPNSTAYKKFGEDISMCVNWLRDSIDILGHRRVYREEMSTAITSGLRFAIYEDSLNYVPTYLKKKESLTWKHKILLESYIKHLLQNLKPS